MADFEGEGEGKESEEGEEGEEGEKGEGQEGQEDPLRLPACGSRLGQASTMMGPPSRCPGDSGAPSSGRTDGELGRLHPNKNRELQAARTGGRKLFDAERKSVFLEWLAATANVSWSAEKAGMCYQTVWKHRMNDPVFAEAFDRALDQGVVRGRARLIETKKPRIDLAGDLESPELDEIDPQTMLAVLREHERGRGGPAAGMGRKQGRRPRIASNAEVRAALIGRLAAYGVRIYGEESEGPNDGGERDSASPLHRPPDGPPPRPGEDR